MLTPPLSAVEYVCNHPNCCGVRWQSSELLWSVLAITPFVVEYVDTRFVVKQSVELSTVGPKGPTVYIHLTRPTVVIYSTIKR